VVRLTLYPRSLALLTNITLRFCLGVAVDAVCVLAFPAKITRPAYLPREYVFLGEACGNNHYSYSVCFTVVAEVGTVETVWAGQRKSDILLRHSLSPDRVYIFLFSGFRQVSYLPAG
jgi:hypothetical protein